MNNSAENKVEIKFVVLTGLILIAAFSRLLPHMYNFSPVGAMGMFGAAYFTRKWQALFIPLAATFLSDLFINNVIYASYYPKFTWFYDGAYFQYITYVLVIVAGFLIFRNRVTTTKILIGALTSTVVFFLMTNFGSWLYISAYPKTAAGLGEAYVAGIPFIKGTVLGDLCYSGLLFGSFALLKQKVSSLRFA